jgi:hypothetical protein
MDVFGLQAAIALALFGRVVSALCRIWRVRDGKAEDF